MEDLRRRRPDLLPPGQSPSRHVAGFSRTPGVDFKVSGSPNKRSARQIFVRRSIWSRGRKRRLRNRQRILPAPHRLSGPPPVSADGRQSGAVVLASRFSRTIRALWGMQSRVNRRWGMKTSGLMMRAVAVMAIMAASAADAEVLSIKTLSTRPDRVSGGDVLVQINQSRRSSTPVMLNGADVSKVFHAGAAAHSREGLVTGLKLGANTLTAGGKSLTVTNYPITGPIVSGPHEVPYICTTHVFPIYSGMERSVPKDVVNTVYGPALDKDCTAATKVVWLYLPKGSDVLQPVANPSDIPADVAMTTTTTGATVKFIVRFETSTIDRGIFQDAVLYDPAAGAPSAANPPKGWNKRIIMVQGAGCPGGWYFQGMRGGSVFSARRHRRQHPQH